MGLVLSLIFILFDLGGNGFSDKRRCRVLYLIAFCSLGFSILLPLQPLVDGTPAFTRSRRVSSIRILVLKSAEGAAAR
jgi:hypothetical protein